MIASMFLVLIGWLYVALMMAAAEATASNGTVLGAIFTFALYGLLPVALVGYLLDTPRRRRVAAAREQAETAARAALVNAPDASREAAAGAEDQAVPAVRKEP